MDRNIKIAIIGSGIAGLSVGIALHKAGFSDVKIYERDHSFDRRRQGYGLTILQGVSALKRLDVYESVKAIDTPSRSHYIFDCNGNIISFFGTIFWPPASSTRKSKYNLHISRQNLRSILYKEFCKLSPGALLWDMKLVGIDKGYDNRWKLEFNEDEFTKVDLVIGCDGINSAVRRQKFPIDVPLKYLGILLVLGITRTSHSLGQGRVFQTVDGNTRLFAMPFYGDEKTSDENIMWQLSFPIDEAIAQELSGNPTLLKENVLKRCVNWHDPIPSLIKSTESSLLIGIPAYDRDPDPPIWDDQILNNLVLLGDAAHPMSPFKGQGANQALLDGISFVDHLVLEKDLDDVVRSFNSEMWGRVRCKVLASRERVTTFHQPDILDGEFFVYRGVSQELLQILRNKRINASSGDQIDELIVAELTRFLQKENVYT